MLAIFNESNNAWAMKSLSQYAGSLYKERTISKNNETVTKKTDIIVAKALGELDLSSFINMNNVQTVYEKNTNVRFQQKDERAILSTGDKYNTDVIAITLTLNGRIIKDFDKTANINCLNYLIAGDELSMVVSVKETNNPADGTSFDIVLHDNKAKVDTTYTFVKKGNEYDLILSTSAATTAIERPSFKFITYRPARVTRLVFVNSADTAAFSAVYTPKNGTGLVAEFAEDTESGDLDTLIAEFKEDKFRAATLFVNADENTVSRKDFKEYTDVVNKLKSNFRVVNVLLNNGLIIKL